MEQSNNYLQVNKDSHFFTELSQIWAEMVNIGGRYKERQTGTGPYTMNGHTFMYTDTLEECIKRVLVGLQNSTEMGYEMCMNLNKMEPNGTE